jgi:hypothetical protein
MNQVFTHTANKAYEQRTQADLVQFLHAACGYPVKLTWEGAIHKGHLARADDRLGPKTLAKINSDQQRSPGSTTTGHTLYKTYARTLRPT